MQTIDKYENNRFARILIQGPPGSGKSTTAYQFPNSHVIDFDVNMRGPLDYLRHHKLSLPLSFSTIDRDDAGVPVPMPARYTRLDTELQAVQKNDQIQTVILDSATNMVDVLVAETLRKQNKTEMSKREWGFFFSYCKQMMSILVNLRKHIIVTAHEKIRKKEDGSVVFPYKVAWPGQFGEIIGAFFSDVWRAEVITKTVGMTESHEFVFRTMPSYQYELKNSLELPPLFKFDWSEIERRLRGER